MCFFIVNVGCLVFNWCVGFDLFWWIFIFFFYKVGFGVVLYGGDECINFGNLVLF